mgnify:CR=1 FL=1
MLLEAWCKNSAMASSIVTANPAIASLRCPNQTPITLMPANKNANAIIRSKSSYILMNIAGIVQWLVMDGNTLGLAAEPVS